MFQILLAHLFTNAKLSKEKLAAAKKRQEEEAWQAGSDIEKKIWWQAGKIVGEIIKHMAFSRFFK